MCTWARRERNCHFWVSVLDLWGSHRKLLQLCFREVNLGLFPLFCFFLCFFFVVAFFFVFPSVVPSHIFTYLFIYLFGSFFSFFSFFLINYYLFIICIYKYQYVFSNLCRIPVSTYKIFSKKSKQLHTPIITTWSNKRDKNHQIPRQARTYRCRNCERQLKDDLTRSPMGCMIIYNTLCVFLPKSFKKNTLPYELWSLIALPKVPKITSKMAKGSFHCLWLPSALYLLKCLVF